MSQFWRGFTTALILGIASMYGLTRWLFHDLD